MILFCIFRITLLGRKKKYSVYLNTIFNGRFSFSHLERKILVNNLLKKEEEEKVNVLMAFFSFDY